MKKLFYALLAALALSALGACTPAEKPVISAPGPGTAAPGQQENTPANGNHSIEEEPYFYEQVAMTFGAKENPGTGELQPLPGLSLYYSANGWASASELTSADAYSWFWGYVSDQPYEELVEKYSSPLGEDYGWFYPQEEFEATLMQYFDVTPEQLRSDPLYYLAEHQGYQMPGPPGIGECPVLLLGTPRSEGEKRILPIELSYPSQASQHMELTILLAGDGQSYQFLSYLPAKPEQA